MFNLTVNTDFPAAHLLRGYEGKCAQLHGHTWKVVATVTDDQLNKLGMVMDFMVLKKHVADVIEYLDHSYLNELPEFKEVNPTAENIAKYIYQELAKRVDPIKVKEIKVYESDRAFATYYE